MKKRFLLLISILFSVTATAQSTITPVIPIPVKMESKQGKFVIRDNTLVIYSDVSLKSDVEYFTSYVNGKYGPILKPMNSSARKKMCITVNRSSDPLLPADGYRLTVDSSAIVIEGGSGAGVFYAFQTLRQLLPPGKTDFLTIPAISIDDHPRFNWRGMHLDVSRHFFTVEEVKKYLDNLAMYKMNTFHWHLTDDQGWRIEIKKYPKLTAIGAWRKGTLIGHYSTEPAKYDTLRYGGFYTQEQIKDVIAYASARHITIVPEIEMPGHASAALAAYPMLGCTNGPFEVGRTWGVFKDVFCPSEVTFNFLEDVLSEVSDLFPGQYIHIGGDECPKDRWKESAFCRELIQKENLKDENGLQSYFVNRIGRFLQTKNKKLIGWDEILEGGIPGDATIMSWRGYTGGIEAAHQKHDVVMTPTAYCYFDYYQSSNPGEPLAIGGYLPVQSVYHFEPVADALLPEEAKYILGSQGNLWTEYVTNWKKVEFMTMPRMAAIAEVTWSPKEKRDYISFVRRLNVHFKMLRFLGVNFSNAVFDVSDQVTPAQGRALAVKLSTILPEVVVHYTFDGTKPTANSPICTGDIIVDQPVVIRAAAFDGMNPIGGLFEKAYSVNLASGKEIRLTNQPDNEYSRGGAFTLIDGVTGRLPWNGADWLGFSGVDCEATIDLSEVKVFNRVAVDVLNDSTGWIYLPTSITVSISADGIDYQTIATVGKEKIEKSGRLVMIPFGKQSARFVKVTIANRQTIPDGAPGAGNKAWLFIDEIRVE